MGERIGIKELTKLFSDFDKNGDGNIDFDEFVHGTARYIKNHSQLLQEKKRRGMSVVLEKAPDLADESGGGESCASHYFFPSSSSVWWIRFLEIACTYPVVLYMTHHCNYD